ncbi:hypothetical protein JB92DRAFT_3125288 [Gautieria morchelliformis]|nr:hypothetical protein JB92DRAFT_3125288 [Gautieria morchelliformis]
MSGVPQSPLPTLRRQSDINNTPAHPKYRHSDHNEPISERHLERKCSALLRDIGNKIPEVPIDWFLEHILPPLPVPRVSVSQVKKRLLNEGTIKSVFPEPPGEGEQSWTIPHCFDQDPAHISETNKKDEDAVFSKLPLFVDHIIAAFQAEVAVIIPGGIGNPDSSKLVHHPKTSPAHPGDYLIRPDGCFMRLKACDGPGEDLESQSETDPSKSARMPNYSWFNIALPCEYKLGASESDRDDNIRKVLYAMAHIMRKDPCRRFTYGLTIENTQTRIWFACRSTVYVTKSFNFIQEHERFIHFALSFCFATEIQMGWDPTIERLSIGSSEQYKIQVQDKVTGKVVYVKTVELIADFGADAVRGRGTRVWKALLRQSDGTDMHVVVKDVWIDADRVREGDIRTMLEEQASNNKTNKNKIAKHFVTVLFSGDVLIDGQIDDTFDFIQRGHEIPPDSDELKLRVHKSNGIAVSVSTGGLPITYPTMPFFRRVYGPKAHYRLIFAQVAQPIYSIRTLPQFFLAMRDAATALQLMATYRWVHRDISPGNILVCENVGLLSDLEYMKQESDVTPAHNVRTGTINFMACEVAEEAYLFNPRASYEDMPTEFRHNPLHDLESLWWIAVWQIFYYTLPPDDSSSSSPTDHHTTEDREERLSLQEQAFFKMFPEDLNNSTRSRIITTQFSFDAITRKCFLEGSKLSKIRHKLNALRSDLLEAYLSAEKDFSETHAIHSGAYVPVENELKGIHEKFIETFQLAANMAPSSTLTPLTSTLQTLGKRLTQTGREGGDDGSSAGRRVKPKGG